MKTSIVHSPAAIAGGVLAAGGALALLVRDGFVTGFTLDHALMPVLVALTILTGHLMGSALRDWKPISFLAFAGLACLGSGLTVYETMGRRAEVRDVKVASAKQSVEEIARAAGDRDLMREIVKEAANKFAKECGTGVGTKCEGKAFTLRMRQASLEKLEERVDKLGTPPPVDPKAERAAALLALFGFAPKAVKANVAVFEPMVLPFFLELGSIFLFGYGVKRHRPATVKVVTSTPPDEGKKVPRLPAPSVSHEEQALRIALGKASGPVTNDELALLMGVTKGEASKRVRDHAHVVKRRRVGRQVAISLH